MPTFDEVSEVIITTTPSVECRPITGYKGIVVGEAIMGANAFRDVFALEAQQLVAISFEGSVG